MLLIVLPTLISALYTITECAKILSIFPIPSKSHAILGHELCKGFAEHGHNVTMLTYYPVQEPSNNFKTIIMDIEKTWHIYETSVIDKHWYSMEVIQIYNAVSEMSKAVFEDKNVQKLINSDETFDAVIYMQCAIDSLLGFSHKFNASSIMFSVYGSSQLSSYTFGHSLPSAYVPNLWLSYNDQMSFWQRFHNWISNIAAELYLNTFFTSRQCRLLRENFPQAPPLEELRAKVELELVNSHITIDTLRPTHQNMINIGGYYMANQKNMSEDIIQFLKKSTNGVILFSFGTNLNSTNMDKQLIMKFIEYFQKSKYDILWNFDVDIANKPANVKIVDWLPQTAVLAHPNVKLFITHAGKGSINEAIYHGVPMIVVPFYADQNANAEYCAQNLIAIKINLAGISCAALDEAVTRIIIDSKYRKNIQLRSKLFKNQEIDPMKKAIYWTEAVIDSNGYGLFQSPVQTMPWYQKMCLDLMVVAFLILAAFVVFICYCWKYCRCSINKLCKNKIKAKIM